MMQLKLCPPILGEDKCFKCRLDVHIMPSDDLKKDIPFIVDTGA